jgi:hypothetical protein
MPKASFAELISTHTLHMVFDESDGPISSRDLTLFLYYYRALYVTLAPNPEVTAERFLKSPDYYIETAKIFLQREFQTEKDVYNNVDLDCGDGDLMVLAISKHSPLEIVVTGITVALVVAVILSGGQIKLPGVQAKLPPLGKGIQELRKAFGLDKERSSTRRKNGQENLPDKK